MNKGTVQMHRRSLEASSDASYCEREPWDDWGSRSSLSHVEEVASQTSEDITSLRAERDALARALANERQRAAAAARAHDARLAELHGVIAELVRRREDKQARAIPEEEVSDECESTTQPAGELDNDADRSRTEQNSSLSPAELPTPHKEEGEGESGVPCVEVSAEGDASLDLSERGSDACLSANRCCELARVSGGSCEREHGSAEARVYTASPGRSSSRQAKLASRVRLRRAADHASDNDSSDEAWLCAAERVSRAVCAHADRSEAAAGARRDAPLSLCAWRARCARLQADCAVLQAALQHAADTAHRLYSACAVHESRLTCVCGALRAADRALEAYDVLLALAETGGGGPERAAAELVGRQLLRRLEAERNALGQPLLSPGPWMTHTQACAAGPWTPEMESRLRGLAASLKADTVALRQRQPPPAFCSHHEIELDDLPRPAGTFNMADMEAAVCLQEVLTAREARAFARAAAGGEGRGDSDDDTDCKDGKSDSCRRSKRRERHWLHTQASETDL